MIPMEDWDAVPSFYSHGIHSHSHSLSTAFFLDCSLKPTGIMALLNMLRIKRPPCHWMMKAFQNARTMKTLPSGDHCKESRFLYKGQENSWYKCCVDPRMTKAKGYNTRKNATHLIRKDWDGKPVGGWDCQNLGQPIAQMTAANRSGGITPDNQQICFETAKAMRIVPTADGPGCYCPWGVGGGCMCPNPKIECVLLGAAGEKQPEGEPYMIIYMKSMAEQIHEFLAILVTTEKMIARRQRQHSFL